MALTTRKTHVFQMSTTKVSPTLLLMLAAMAVRSAVAGTMAEEFQAVDIRDRKSSDVEMTADTADFEANAISQSHPDASGKIFSIERNRRAVDDVAMTTTVPTPAFPSDKRRRARKERRRNRRKKCRKMKKKRRKLKRRNQDASLDGQKESETRPTRRRKGMKRNRRKECRKLRKRRRRRKMKRRNGRRGVTPDNPAILPRPGNHGNGDAKLQTMTDPTARKSFHAGSKNFQTPTPTGHGDFSPGVSDNSQLPPKQGVDFYDGIERRSSETVTRTFDHTATDRVGLGTTSPEHKSKLGTGTGRLDSDGISAREKVAEEDGSDEESARAESSPVEIEGKRRFDVQRIAHLFRGAVVADEKGLPVVSMDDYIRAYSQLADVFQFFGSILAIARYEVDSKLAILTKLRAPDTTGTGSKSEHYETFRSMFVYEFDTGIAFPGAPQTSGVRENAWIHRPLRFILSIVQTLAQPSDSEPLSAKVKRFYQATMAPHHAWVVRMGVYAAIAAFPSRETLLARMKVADNAEGTRQLTELADSIQTVYDVIQAHYDDFSPPN